MTEVRAPEERRDTPREPSRPSRPPRGSSPAVTPAGRALAVAVLALVLAMVFNSAAMVRAGEGMPAGATRDLVLSVARPVDTVAQALWLDRPRQALDRALGHEAAPVGPSQLTSQGAADADKAPVGSRAGSVPPPADLGAGGLPPLRAPTPAAPLRLLVAGDSMTEFAGPALLNLADGSATSAGKVDGATVTKYGTGLVRPDFFDWSLYAQQLVEERDPEAVVVMMGGNDGQGITLADGSVLAEGSDEWAREYRRRAEVVMRVFADGGSRRVYWVGMPVARSERLAHDYRLINLALADAASAVPGAAYVDIAARLSVNGRYSDFLTDDGGRRILARARDGIHLSQDGARLAAGLVLARLDQDWALTR